MVRDAPHVGLEVSGERVVEGGDGTVGLELDDVQRQLVAPRDRALLDLAHDGPRLRAQHLVADRSHLEGLGVDEHVLQLDPMALEEPQRRAHVTASGLRRASSRRRKSAMMRR